MRTTLTSRERLLAAIALQEPDHVPLWCLWSYDRPPFDAPDPRTRIDAVLALGMDDTLWLHAPWGPAPQVRISAWSEPAPGTDYRLLHKRYETPAGTVQHVLRSSQYLSGVEQVGVLGDLNISHSLEFLVKNRGDLGPLRYLLADPDSEQLARFREQAAAYRRFASERQVLLEGAYVSLGDAVAWLMGPENLIYAFQDDPGCVEELLEVIWRWHCRQVEILLEERVDVILHRAWYEIPDFWGLEAYRRFLKPLLRREVEMVHQAGARFSYIMTKGVMPLLDDFLELGMDVLWGPDPVQGQADLPRLREKLGGRMCTWGGMNAVLTLGTGTPQDARRAVEEAIRTLAPGGGFVLFPVDQIIAGTPWENIQAMLERWRELASYPLSL
ncbi:MAG: uroporphyrinogen decarboxylase family protein [Candidatus Latescibacterota bacterium]